jgi:hypothetical protein
MSADAGGAGVHSNAAAPDAVAALRQLVKVARQAKELGRTARAVELYERALAAAEASMPADSLVLANQLDDLVQVKLIAAGVTSEALGTSYHAAAVQAFGSDEWLLTLSRKALMLYDARFRAGTLFMSTPEEDAFFNAQILPVHFFSAQSYLDHAEGALTKWPPPRTRDEDEACMRAVHGALQAALDFDRRRFVDWWDACPDGSQQTRSPLDGLHAALAMGSMRSCVDDLLTAALDTSTVGAWQRLHAACTISAEEEAALRQLMQRNRAELPACRNATATIDDLAQHMAAEQQQRTTSDIARFGLRTCALPECQHTEPHPKAFKVCGRCRSVCYCSAAHQQADWRRHKRADGCAAAAGAAGQ